MLKKMYGFTVMLVLCFAMVGCSQDSSSENEALKKQIADLEEEVATLQKEKSNSSEEEADKAEGKEMSSKPSTPTETDSPLGTWVFGFKEQSVEAGLIVEVSENNGLLDVKWLNNFRLETGDGTFQYEILQKETSKWTVKEVSAGGVPSENTEEEIIEWKDGEIVTFPLSTGLNTAVKVDTTQDNLVAFEVMNGDWLVQDAEVQLELTDDHLIYTGYDEGDEMYVDIYYKNIGVTANDELVLTIEKFVSQSTGEERLAEDSMTTALLFKVEDEDTLIISNFEEVPFKRK